MTETLTFENLKNTLANLTDNEFAVLSLIIREKMSLNEAIATLSLSDQEASVLTKSLLEKLKLFKTTKFQQELQARNEKVYNLFKDGKSTKQIADDLTLDLRLVQKIIQQKKKELGLDLVEKQNLQKRNEEILRLFKETKLSYKEIASLFGLTEFSIIEIVKKFRSIDSSSAPKRKAGKRPNTARNKLIVDIYNSGCVSFAQIAKAFDVRVSVVDKIYRLNNTEKKVSKVDKNSKKKVLNSMFKLNLSTEELNNLSIVDIIKIIIDNHQSVISQTI
ncbi:MAG: hypothetical protein E7374_00035 [Clostridiales bacterium]|nr:hypothetical protein [Clostridiales bacterium]